MVLDNAIPLSLNFGCSNGVLTNHWVWDMSLFVRHHCIYTPPFPFWHDGLVVGDNICGRSRGQPLFTLPCSCLVAEWNYQDVWPSWLDTRWTTGVAWHHGEVKLGFLEGPYSEDEMSVLLGTDQWSFNPRFVLFQGASKKVRIIDDAKKSCPNNAFSSTVKLQLQDVDYVAAMGQLAC